MTASLIKKFRDDTQQGMMDCKKFITQAKENLGANASEDEIYNEALELLAKSTSGKVKKRASMSAKEGLIITNDASDYAYILELNCETDFVARNEVFQQFSKDIADLAVTQKPATLPELLDLDFGGQKLSSACEAMIVKLGENIKISKFYGFKSTSGSQFVAYNHGGRLAVVVEYQGDSNSGKDVALHVAANNPAAVDEASIPQELLKAETEMYESQAKESGKPEDVQAKMVQGKVKKFLADVTLLGQKFVKDEDVTVAEFLSKNSTKVIAFKRVVLGELEEV